MKRDLLALAVMMLVVSFFTPHNVEAQCPQDTNDLGIADTIYFETFDGDHVYQAEIGSFDSVRVAIYVTHDSNTFQEGVQDSIALFFIPLVFWHQPEGCVDSVIFPTFDYWNNHYINPYLPYANRSMFRHLVDERGDTVYNRLLQMVENGKTAWTAYATVKSNSYDGDSGRVLFGAWTLSAGCQRWWEGSRVLLATFTFHVYMSGDCDTMEIGIDSTFAPPAGHLCFQYYTEVYSPCNFLPVNDTIYIPTLLCGDCNGDGGINIADVVCFINYLFAGEPSPGPLCILDANCDTIQNIADVVYLINYLFTGVIHHAQTVAHNLVKLLEPWNRLNDLRKRSILTSKFLLGQGFNPSGQASAPALWHI